MVDRRKLVGTVALVLATPLALKRACQGQSLPAAWSNVLPFGASATLWDDLRCPVSALAPGATPADPIVYGPSGAVRIRGFNGAGTTESMDFTAQLPHSYKEGTNLEPRIHWCPSTNDAGNVIWHLDYYWLNLNGTIPALTQVDTGAVAAGGVAWKHLVAELPVISGAGKLISSMLMCRIWRDPTGLDTYPEDAGLLEVDFHFQQDAAGSRQEFVK
jgi:hypothetical protein